MKNALIILTVLAGIIFFSGCGGTVVLRPEDLKAYVEKEGKPFEASYGQKVVILDGQKITEIDSRSSDYYFRDNEGNIVRGKVYHYNGHYWGYYGGAESAPRNPGAWAIW